MVMSSTKIYQLWQLNWSAISVGNNWSYVGATIASIAAASGTNADVANVTTNVTGEVGNVSINGTFLSDHTSKPMLKML